MNKIVFTFSLLFINATTQSNNNWWQNTDTAASAQHQAPQNTYPAEQADSPTENKPKYTRLKRAALVAIGITAAYLLGKKIHRAMVIRSYHNHNKTTCSICTNHNHDSATECGICFDHQCNGRSSCCGQEICHDCFVQCMKPKELNETQLDAVIESTMSQANLTPEQVRSMNPIIRSTLYRWLRTIANKKQPKPCCPYCRNNENPHFIQNT